MPIKSFDCQECKHRFFRLLKREEYDATAHAQCPQCQAEAAAILSVPAKRNPAYGIQN